MSRLHTLVQENAIDIVNQLGMSQSDLARRMQVSRSRVHQILWDKDHPMRLETVEKLARALKVKPLRLFRRRR